VQLSLLVDGLGRRGVDQRVVVPRGAALSERLDTIEVPIAGRWLGGGAIADAVRRFRPHVVAVHTAHAHALVPLDQPVVVHRRVDFVPSRWSGARYRRALGVIAVSRAVAGIVGTTGAVRVRVVHDGVPPGPVAEMQGGAGFLTVGALVPHKDHKTLLRAMVEVPHALDIVGDGPLRKRLEALSIELGLGERVRFWGHRSDVPAFLHRALALVHPSREEGLGQVVLEALTRGLPVVATRAGGLIESVEGHGRLVAPRCPGELAAALREMATDHVRWRAHLQRTQPDRRLSWGVDAMVDGTLRAYEDWTGIGA
jgi:glycosyltransferase involved in cell wall biosynthesis